jgi:hypothetical protein
LGAFDGPDGVAYHPDPVIQRTTGDAKTPEFEEIIMAGNC